MGLFYAAYGVANILLFLALRAKKLTSVITFFSLGVFFLTSFQAAEFSLLQRILPQENFPCLARLYNGLAILVGLGPALLSRIIGNSGGTWVITVIALVCGALLFALHRRVVY